MECNTYTPNTICNYFCYFVFHLFCTLIQFIFICRKCLIIKRFPEHYAFQFCSGPQCYRVGHLAFALPRVVACQLWVKPTRNYVATETQNGVRPESYVSLALEPVSRG